MSGLESLSRGSRQTTGAVPPPRRRWFGRVVLPTGILLVTAALLAYASRESWWPATTVSVVRVAVRDAPADASSVLQTSDAAGASAATVSVQAPGWVEPDPFPVYVSALADGVVEDVLVLEGAHVKADQVVARLIDDDARLAVTRAEAELQRRQAELKAAETDWQNPVALKRAVAVSAAMVTEAVAARAQLDADIEQQQAKLKELESAYDRVVELSPNAASELEVEQARFRVAAQQALLRSTEKQRPVLDARTDRYRAESAAAKRDLELRVVHRRALDEARAAVRDAQTALAEAKLRLERMAIKSPIAGVVMRLLAVPGAKVMLAMDSSHSAHIVHLYDPSKLQVRVDVPLSDAAKVGVGQRTQVVVDVLPDQSFNGRVTRFVHEADISKNTVQVKVAIDEPSPLLKPDMLARVKFLAQTEGGVASTGPASATTRVYIPDDVIREDGNEQAVWVVLPNRTVERRAVETGGRRGDGWVEVTSGLRAGDTVVADRSVTLTQHQKVNPAED